MTDRKATRRVMVGKVPIGAGAPIAVQSMTKTDTRDVKATVEQIRGLEEVGCEIVRCAVPDTEAALALGKIVKRIKIPLVADIHFDYRLALESIKQGVAGLRINPGNIGGAVRVKRLAQAAGEMGVPIRIGVNSGSLEKSILAKYGHPCAEAMVESALAQLRVLEETGFRDVKISVKAPSVPMTVKAYRLLSEATDCPLHLGVTEAGTSWAGAINSAVGIGILLGEGIGDTVRVSLTSDPVEEVRVAYQILKSLGLREAGPTLVSCPSCGRTQVDIARIALEVEKGLARFKEPLTVAVMGCAVNGPGEAREADVGLAAGKGEGLVFRNGKVVRKVKEKRLVSELLAEVGKAVETMDALCDKAASGATGRDKKKGGASAQMARAGIKAKTGLKLKAGRKERRRLSSRAGVKRAAKSLSGKRGRNAAG